MLSLYLDTADVTQWRTWLPTGMFYGITCNPILLARAGVPCNLTALEAIAQEAIRLDAQEVQLQAWGTSVDQLHQVGQALASFDQRIVVKLPATPIGTTAAAALIREGIPVTLTAIYAVRQVLIAAAIGASYAAPYLGRISDLGMDGRLTLVAMQQALNGVGSSTRLLSASIRDIEDISLLAAQGVNTFTFSEAIAQAFFNVPATISATEDFEQAVLESNAPESKAPESKAPESKTKTE
jgi:transaldolase